MQNKTNKSAEAFGLALRELDAILAIIVEFPTVERALVFGSRAMGNYHEGSDVDIALFGPSLETKTAWSIGARLDALELLLRFDVLVYNDRLDAALRAHIDRVGKLLYQRQ
jgi:uncharacterized protein